MVALLDVENLKMYYRLPKGWVKAVDDISFSIDRGETLGFVGESGCGKTSILYSIMRLIPENAKIMEGKIVFDGTDLLQIPEDHMRKIRWKRISMIFQNAMNALDPVLRVGDQIVEALTVHEKLSKTDAWDRVESLFELVGLSGSHVRNYPHQFSGGMRQRAIIAMSLACDPELILADEPVTALDVVVQDQILGKIRDLQESKRMAMIIVSHDISVIAETCEKMDIVYGGRIVEHGDTLSLFRDPRHPYTIALLHAFPSLRGSKRDLVSIEGDPPDLLNPPEGCVFQPRCPIAGPICKTRPARIFASSDHFSECHFAADSRLNDVIRGAGS